MRVHTTMALCMLCLFARHKSEFCRNGWKDPAGFGIRSIPPLILHCVVTCKEILVSLKITLLPSETLSQTLNLTDFFSPRHVNRRNCCRLSSTDDRRQFVTVSDVSVPFVYNTVDVTLCVARFVCDSWDLYFQVQNYLLLTCVSRNSMLRNGQNRYSTAGRVHSMQRCISCTGMP